MLFLFSVKQVGFYQLHPPLQKPETSTKLTTILIYPTDRLIYPWGQSSANSLIESRFSVVILLFSTAPQGRLCSLSHVPVSA